MLRNDPLGEKELKLRRKLMHQLDVRFPNMRFDRRTTRQVFATVNLDNGVARERMERKSNERAKYSGASLNDSQTAIRKADRPGVSRKPVVVSRVRSFKGLGKS